MAADAWTLLRPLLFAMPPERAHELVLRSLATGLAGVTAGVLRQHPSLARTVAGLTFPNPVGIAAGFDKDGRVPLAILRLGFGFTEVGTTTPRPQPGNPRPRVFRLVEDEALINRLGFNNAGHDALARRLARLPPRGARPGVIGVNIGANKDAEDRIADYALGMRRFALLGDYVTVNISSPNTPGLRELQGRDALTRLLESVLDARERALPGGERCPVFVKLSPDLAEAELEDCLAVIEASAVEGIIVSNTTNARPATLRSRARAESGGLSGRPLFTPSTAMLRAVKSRLDGSKALIGVGGVDGPGAARAKLDAGADLVQLYTGAVYRGPGLVGEILDGLAG